MCQFMRDLWFVGYDPFKYEGPGWTASLSLYDKRVSLEVIEARPNPQWSVESWPESTSPCYTDGRHCETFMLVYDVTSRASFEAVKAYHRNFCLERSRSNTKYGWRYYDECPPRPPFQGITFVFAKTIDRDKADWQVSLQEGREFADSIGPLAEFITISVETCEGCSRTDVEAMAKRIILRRTQDPPFANERAARVEKIRKERSTPPEQPMAAYHHCQLFCY